MEPMASSKCGGGKKHINSTKLRGKHAALKICIILEFVSCKACKQCHATLCHMSLLLCQTNEDALQIAVIF